MISHRHFPEAKDYLHTDTLTFNFGATDVPAGVAKIEAKLDGSLVTNGQSLDLFILALGEHTFTVNAWDKAGNQSTQSVTFTVSATVDTLFASIKRFVAEGKIDNSGIQNSLVKKLQGVQDAVKKGQIVPAINKLQVFINEVQAQSGKHITTDAANQLIADAQWVIAHLK